MNININTKITSKSRGRHYHIIEMNYPRFLSREDFKAEYSRLRKAATSLRQAGVRFVNVENDVIKIYVF